ncbi:MAG TPA: leucine--tRNA ligase, partial [Chthonomonadaceae bacterium]|nr:leucine--tRNA ligase [Chthonomonadaceae bacterium]
GAYATNPVNGHAIPIWIADYVLMGYGTGAIMAVPAHDQRDFEFARRFGIPIALVFKQLASDTEADLTEATTDSGSMAVGPFIGAPNSKETVRRVIAWLEERGAGRGVVNYRLRDWLISRQRYWGAPIPIIHCPEHGAVPVPEGQLPVLLPPVEKYQPTGTGESPLAGIPEFVNTVCPVCGKPARRETDTMGGFACSSWYFLRFADPHNEDAPFSQEAVKHWLPVDEYVGGTEHAVMHLLYARFWTKVIHDAGLVAFDEPFQRLRNQGKLLAYTAGRAVAKSGGDGAADETDGDEPIEDWKVLRADERRTVPESDWVWRWVKMSKSMNNVVTPDQMAEEYGADSLRLYTLFVAPFEETVQWQEKAIEGAHRFANRMWRIWTELRPHYDPAWQKQLGAAAVVRGLDAALAAAAPNEIAERPASIAPASLGPGERALRRKLHRTIRKVTDDIEQFRGNTCVAALMELTNELSAFRNSLGGAQPSPLQVSIISEILETLPLLLSPIAPHLADEFWERLGKDGFTYCQAWPVYDAQAAAEDSITIVLQVNGKLRDRMSVQPGTPDADIERLARANAKIQADIAGKPVRKVIVVPAKLVNFVVG